MRNILLPYVKTLLASAARTATANSGALKYPADLIGSLFVLDVTAASGTSPTLDVAIQITPDDGTTWYAVERFTQMTTTSKRAIYVNHGILPWSFVNPSVHISSGTEIREFTIADTGGLMTNHVPFSRKFRVLATIGGTNPSFTFSVSQFSNRYQTSGSNY